MENAKRIKRTNVIILIVNFLLIILAIISTMHYSTFFIAKEEKRKLEDYENTIESMKKLSQKYLDTEMNHVVSWATYIENKDMTIDEALDFLRDINSDSKIFGHIVDLDTYYAYSSFYPKGEEIINSYKVIVDADTEYANDFASTMERMLSNTPTQYELLGRYQTAERNMVCLGVGKKISIKNSSSTKKEYLLLKIIPEDEIRRNWVFPVEYSSAEIGIIDKYGNYVLQSSSMKSKNFLEYIRAYNFPNSYYKIDEVAKKLKNNDIGTMNYKNFRGVDCTWYFSSMGKNTNLKMLGCINTVDLKSNNNYWIVTFIISGTIILLFALDILFILKANKILKVRTKEAMAASESKTNFLSSMSHDIRTPLNAVLGLNYMALQHIDDKEYVKKCLVKGSKAGRQLLTLINDVLDISKIESGNISINNSIVSISSLFYSLVEVVEPLAISKNITLNKNLLNVSSDFILADRLRLEQICTNLLTNAVKYTNEGGEVSFSIEEKFLLNNKATLKIEIADNGIGMSEEYQKTMYQSFTREVNSRVNSIQGAGLGLHIVKLIVDKMNGEIICHSKENEGTTFIINLTFDIANSQEEIDIKKSKDYSSLKGLNLLIAEDNDINYDLIHSILTDFGVNCTWVENGMKCLEVIGSCAEGTYDAILMDVHMPIMGGIEATRIIRNSTDRRINNIPIIALTADAFQEDVEKCLACGMNAHIAKPIEIDKLYYALLKNKVVKEKGGCS